MDNSAFYNLKENHVIICINGIEYSISAFFSINCAETYLECLNKTDDCKMALANIIYAKIKESGAVAPTFEEISCEDDTAFSDFIFAVLNDDNDLKVHFDRTNVDYPLSKRFAIAYKAYWKKSTEKAEAALKPMTDIVEKFTKSINLPLLNQVQRFSEMQRLLARTQIQQLSGMQQLIGKVQMPWFNSIQHMANQTNFLNSALAGCYGYVQQLSRCINAIKVPSISEERKQELIDSYTRWGELGWTLLPNAPFDVYKWYPSSTTQANKVAMQYCHLSDMKQLFELLKKQNIRKVDYNEAVLCYKSRRYKACALVLSGIIDSKLISKQPKPKKENGWRPIGQKVARQLKYRFEKENNANRMFFTALEEFNLMAYLDKFFDQGNDFKFEPQILNRNFIAHGMNVRDVRRRDCIQLFLALHNLMNLLEYL